MGVHATGRGRGEMSRYRNVHCLIWNDDKFPFASDDCQLVWFHLKTTPLTGPIDIYKASLAGLAEEKRWSLQRYRKAFAEGLAKGFWKYDEKFHVVLFPKFFKHNKPENPNVLKSWLKFYVEVPDCELKNESIQSLKAFAEGWGEPFLKVLVNLTPNLCETGTGTGTGIKTLVSEPEKLTDECPHQEIIKIFHSELPMLTRIKDWTPARQELLRARWRSKEDYQDVEWWREFFAYIREKCPFLVGQNSSGNGKRPWQADLPWILEQKHFTKIIEGGYEQ